MTDELKNHVSKSVFLAMIGLVIAMSVAVYVRYEKNNEQAAITNYRISQLESENRSLAKKYYLLEKSLSELRYSLDADGAVTELDGEENNEAVDE